MEIWKWLARRVMGRPSRPRLGLLGATNVGSSGGSRADIPVPVATAGVVAAGATMVVIGPVAGVGPGGRVMGRGTGGPAGPGGPPGPVGGPGGPGGPGAFVIPLPMALGNILLNYQLPDRVHELYNSR